MTPTLVLLAALGVAALDQAAPDPGATPEARVIEVRMVDKSPTEFAFEPARVVARPGDTIRFIQTGEMPHNVEFKGPSTASVPEGLRMSPYLTRRGQAWDLVVGNGFETGAYDFVCTPHQFLGMTGVLVVEP